MKGINRKWGRALLVTLTNSISSWWRRRQILRIWWWEITCCVLNAAALFVIVVTLRMHENRPLPDWPYGISINALIAIFTTVMKVSAGLALAEGISHLKWASLTQPRSLRSFQYHDNASRGPWGSIQLLWLSKGRSMSSLGAFITILILLLDPFSQQILRFHTCRQMYMDGAATIPRAQQYFVEVVERSQNVVKKPEVGQWGGPIMGIRSAANAPIYSLNIPKVPVSCPTGNCTFLTSYSSLGFCSRCQDRSQDLITLYRTDDVGDTYPYHMINITLPIAMASQKYGFSRMKNLSIDTFANEPDVSFAMKTDYEKGFTAMIRFGANNMSMAYTCTVYPCVKTFSAEVDQGVLKETMEKEHHNAFDIERPNYINVGDLRYTYSAADLQCVNQLQRDHLKELGYNWNATMRFIPYEMSVVGGTKEEPWYAKVSSICDPWQPNCTSEGDSDSAQAFTKINASTIPAPCIYTIDASAQTTLWSYLLHKFNGTMGYDQSGTQSTSEDHLLALYTAGSGNGTLTDMSNFFTNISDSLTTYVRQHGYEPLTSPAPGTASYAATCVGVQWAWVGYAVTTAALLVVFFVGMVMGTRVDHDFKSSALTLLYHGLEEESRQAGLGKTNSEVELYDRVKGVKVRLVATEEGWRLRTVSPDGEKELL